MSSGRSLSSCLRSHIQHTSILSFLYIFTLLSLSHSLTHSLSHSLTFALAHSPLSLPPQLTTLELQYVSPKLMSCVDLELAVPGTYEPNQPVVHIRKVSATLNVITSKQRPRKLVIQGRARERGGGRGRIWLVQHSADAACRKPRTPQSEATCRRLTQPVESCVWERAQHRVICMRCGGEPPVRGLAQCKAALLQPTPSISAGSARPCATFYRAIVAIVLYYAILSLSWCSITCGGEWPTGLHCSRACGVLL